MTTVTNNSPQAINTSLFSLEKDTDEKAKLLNEKLNEVNSAIAEINKILDGINKDAGVVSVNGKQGIVVLDASDIGGLATVATSGDYNDLSNKPTIPAAQVNSDWNATSGVARILNKPSLASVATSGNYNDLSNKPTIPTATSQLTNDSGFVSPQNVLFNDADVPEGSGNLNTTATAHKITTYRNGLTIPYQMDDTNDGGLLRVRGTSEDNCIFELGTWDDSGSGETIQFNYYPTTSKDTPTHSVSVPKKSGTIALTSDVPTRTSQLTNDSGFITSSATVDNASKLGGWSYLLSAATSGSQKWIAIDSWSWNTSKGYIKFSNGFLLQWAVINDQAGGYENVELLKSYTSVDTYACFRQVNRDTEAGDQWAKSSMAVPYDVNHVRIYREPAATSKGFIFAIGY